MAWRQLVGRAGPWLLAAAVLSLVWAAGREPPADERLVAQLHAVRAVDRQLRELDGAIDLSTSRLRLALGELRPEQRPVLVASALQQLNLRGEAVRGRLDAALRELEAATAAAAALGALAAPQEARLRRQLPILAEHYATFLAEAAALATTLDGGDEAALGEALQSFEKEYGRLDGRLRATVAALAGWGRALEQALEAASRAPSGDRAVPLAAWLLALAGAGLALVPRREARALAGGARAWLARLGRSAPATQDERLATAALTAMGEELERAQARLVAAEARVGAEQAAARRAGQELALSRLYAATLVENIRHGLVVTDAQLRVSACNRAAAELLGLDDAALGRPLDELPPWRAAAERHGLRALLERALASGQVSQRAAIELGGERPRVADLVLSPYLDEVGQARGVLILLEDVSEEVRMRARLLESERLATVGRLAAQVAHEVRNPLSSIGLNVDLLAEDLRAQPAQDLAESRARLERIAAEVVRLEAITGRYLELARLPGPILAPCDLNQVVGGTLSFVAEDLRQRQVRVSTRLVRQELPVSVDEGQLRQALLNVLRNAWEAMPSGGTLLVETGLTEGQAWARLANSGPPIPPELRQSIFDPFFTTKAGGTGLGLSITAQIVRENGGRIRYDERPGEAGAGEAAFVIEFPCPGPAPGA